MPTSGAQSCDRVWAAHSPHFLSMPETLVHLTFPKDLQQHLSANIPSHLNIKIQTSLYPTYKSRKPIALATQNFLAWSALPSGPVILVGHSMGGLLAADAATDPSNATGSKPHRIIGVVAFDVPFLGMHPHVVVSGIASLFTDDDEDKATEGEMNQHSDVQIVDDKVTDDWDAFKKDLDAHHSSHSLHSRSHSPVASPAPTSPAPTSPASLAPPANPFGLPASPLVDKTLSFLSTHSNDPVVRWVRKHSDEPFSAGKRFIVEYFQFGSCMFDPSDLKDRYARLVAWPGGLGEHAKKLNAEEEEADNDMALLQTGMTSMSTGESYATADTSLSSSASTSTAAPSISSTLASPSPSDWSLNPPPSGTKALEKAAKAAEKERRSVEKAREKELKKIRTHEEQAWAPLHRPAHWTRKDARRGGEVGEGSDWRGGRRGRGALWFIHTRPESGL
ncbi:hypothetical protein B0H10DRAFT_2004126 [Mycena sp. CBHHK59/15]|nr:hypothetical protein B0H10DRAFT_2004126 [Mycena sp. CBHHK59/15]